MAYKGDERILSPNEWVNIIEKSNDEIVEMYKICHSYPVNVYLLNI
ncbi:hypothetical protein [Streptococcus orisratti]